MADSFWDSKKVDFTVSEISEKSPGNMTCVCPSFTETFNLIAPIVNFNAAGSKPQNILPYPKLSQLLTSDAKPSKISGGLNHSSGKPSFRWIHVPVNKMDWARVYIKELHL